MFPSYASKIVAVALWLRIHVIIIPYLVFFEYILDASRLYYVLMLGTAILSEWASLGSSSHVDPVRLGIFAYTIELLHKFIQVFFDVFLHLKGAFHGRRNKFIRFMIKYSLKEKYIQIRK